MSYTPHLISTGASDQAPDASFETFIDSNLVLDSSVSESDNDGTSRKATSTKSTSLSTLPPHISASHQTGGESPSTPTISDTFHYPSPTVTSGQPASLHNLSFDFSFEVPPAGQHGQHLVASISSQSQAAAAFTKNMEPMSLSSYETNSTTAGITSAPMTWASSEASLMDASTLFPMSLGMSNQGHAIDAGPTHHHGRSLSLRDVVPPMTRSEADKDSSQLQFPPVSIKSEYEAAVHQAGTSPTASEGALSPFTEDRSSPTSSGASTSLFDHGSPRMEKRRRLASPADSFVSFTGSVKSSNGIEGTAAEANVSKKAPTAPKRNRGNTVNKQSQPQNDGQEARPVPTQTSMASSTPISTLQPSPSSQQNSMTSNSGEGNTPLETSSSADLNKTNQPPKGKKRPPPSASQVTESGMPFPVIDTSAKHSTLFVPPDTSGLTKREARLVKNRAAAFLSRQRKREQFEELDQKCKHLCRGVWKMWEVIVGPGRGWEAFAGSVLPMLLDDEHPEVKQALEQVIMLKGGSIAPTEDGQLQGAVDMNGVDACSSNDTSAPNPSSAALSNTNATSQANASQQEDHSEIARLRAELLQSHERESALRLELANERTIRNETESNQQRMPFRSGARVGQDLSLTIAPEVPMGNEAHVHGNADHEDVSGQRKGNRASERIQRQQQYLASSQPNVHGGQRKAAGAALMMVLFSFAMFGLPGGQMTKLGGLSRTGSVDDYSFGKVIGAPVTEANYGVNDDEEEEDVVLDGSMQPSSHLSARDLLPPDVSDLLSLEDTHLDDADGNDAEKRDSQRIFASTSRKHAVARRERKRRDSISAFQQILASSNNGTLELNDWLRENHGEDVLKEQSTAGEAFARDLRESLGHGFSGVDVERSFILIGSPEEKTPAKVDSMEVDDSSSHVDRQDEEDPKPPTKLTLFVPAPDPRRPSNDPMSPSEGDSAEDCFYDAPLAGENKDDSKSQTSISSKLGNVAKSKANHDSNQKLEVGDISQKTDSQVEATRAALRVLRDHRFGASIAGGAPRPSASQRIRKSESSSTGGDRIADPSKDEAATDAAAQSDFYELQFSLSGARVRNVKELAGLILAAARRRKFEEAGVGGRAFTSLSA